MLDLSLFKMEIFYGIYKPLNVFKTTIKKYKKSYVSNEQLYDDIININIIDFQPNRRKMFDLYVTISLSELLEEYYV